MANFVTELILNSFACLIMLSLMVVYLKYFCVKSKVNKQFNLLLLGSLLSSFIYIFGNYIYYVIIVLALQYPIKDLPDYCFVSTLIGCANIIQRLQINVFFIMRLYLTFKGSVVEIKKRTIIIIASLICITFTLGIISNLTISSFIKHVWCGDHNLRIVYGLSWLITYMCDWFWSILLSVLYIKKLRQLVKMINTNNNRKDNKLFNITNKLTILIMVAVATSVILILSHPFFSSVLDLTGVLLAIDSIINNICVMLSFAIFDKSYKRYCYCCIKIHNKCCDIQDNDIKNLIKEIEFNDSTKSSQPVQ